MKVRKMLRRMAEALRRADQDIEAMEQIHRILVNNGEEWDAGTIELVAEVVVSTGRVIPDPNDSI